MFAVVSLKGLKIYQYNQMSSVEKLNTLWEQDMKRLRQTNHIPEQVFNAKTIKPIFVTENAKKWKNQIRIPILENPKGKGLLEILVISIDDVGQEAIVIQLDFMSEKDNILLYEIGRTYPTH